MNFSVNGQLRRAVYAAFASSLAGFGATAFAQDAAPAPVPPAEAAAALPIEALPAAPAAAPAKEEAVKLERVQVTGSRIRRVDAEKALPVAIIDRAVILQSGVTTVGELIQELPSISGAASNPRVNNGGGDGASTVSLRGLGEDRTLLLLNGRRLVQQDVNSIPLNLIQRVEILKEGASAIYGSDAIGGVVNFITRKDFKNLEIGADFGISGKGDGERRGLGISWGASSDKANLMLGINYNQQDAVSAADRGFSKFATYLSSGSVYNGGSSRNPRGRITLDRATTGAQYNCPGTGATVDVSRIEGRSGDSAADYQCYVAARDAYNYQAVGNVVSTPQERLGLFTVGNYTFNDHVEGYAEIFANTTRSSFIIAPLPFDARNDDVIVSADNAYNPFDTDFGGIDGTNPNLLSRFEALGNRTTDFRTNVAQLNLGLRGDLVFIPEWKWDAGVGYGRVEQDVNRIGYIYGPALKDALGPSFQRADGSFGCGTSAATEIQGCLPVNIFNLGSDPAQVAALQSVSANAGTSSATTLKTASINFSGDLFNLPAGPLGMAFGAEYRKFALTSEVDFLARALPPDNTTCYLAQEVCSNATNGNFSVSEYFVEALVPVLSNLPFVKSLNANVGVRLSDYSNFGTTTNSSFKVEYRPNDDILIRGTYAEVFRAPTITDLFTPPSANSPQFADPCEGITTPVGQNANLDKTCENVPRDGSYSPATSQVTGIVSGNPDLGPESGKVYTYGFVFDPSWEVLKGASISLDYWRYSLKDTIETLQPDTVAQQCLNTGNEVFCSLIQRAPDGQIAQIGQPTFNLGNVLTSGLDLGLGYRLPKTPFGRFNFKTDVTYISKYDRTPDASNPGFVVHNAGTYSKQDGNYSRVRSVSSLNWANWGFDATFAARFISGYSIGAPGSNQASADGSLPGVELKLGDTWYYDMNAGYKVKATNTKFQVGVENLSNEKPPLQYQNNSLNANVDVNTFDTIGRYFFFKVIQTF